MSRARSVSRVEERSPLDARTRWGGDVVLLATVCIASATSWSTTARWFNLIPVAAGVVLIALALALDGMSAPRAPTLALSIVLGFSVQAIYPPTGNISKSAFYPWGIGLGLVALGLVLVGVVVRRTAPVLLGGAVLAVSALCTVAGGRRPQIDVWLIFQQSAAGLFHGVNPYATTFTGIPAGQTADCFNYLPATLLPTWIGWVTLDDVRWGETAVMLAGWIALGVVIARRAGRRQGLALLAVAATAAGTLRMAQQAWNESLLLGFLLIAVALLASGRRAWAIVPLALALATKQHAALLVPLFVLWPALGWRRAAWSVAGAAAVSAPWVLWDFGRFKACTVDFFLDITPRFDSISLWQFVPGPLQTVAVLVGLAGAYVVALRFVPRTPAGLLVGGGLVLFGFDLVNKQTFENQWWLVCELILCGLALHVTDLHGAQERSHAVAG